MKDIIKQPQPSYEKESTSLLNSLSSEERDRLLSENVQIEVFVITMVFYCVEIIRT